MSVKNNKGVAKKIGCLTAGLIFAGALCGALALILDEKFPRCVTVQVCDRNGKTVENRYMRKRRF